MLAERKALSAHVLIRVGDPLRELRESERVALQAVRIDVDVELLRLSPEPDHVDHAGHLPELPFEDEVFGGLQLGERVPGPLHRVAEDLADRAPRRELRLQARRQLDELQPVHHALLRGVIFGVPAEIALHVGEPEQRLRADVLEVDHPREPVFQRDGDVPLHFLGAPAGGLRDHLDHRSHRIGIGLDVHPRVAPEAHAEQTRSQGHDDEGHRQRLLHQPTHQSIPLRSSAPEMTTASPACSPDFTGT